MVYRGKPSAGCVPCRKAKKRCGLELPACSRCAHLRKECFGYRDTTQLQLRDESENVRRKAQGGKAVNGEWTFSASSATPSTSVEVWDEIESALVSADHGRWADDDPTGPSLDKIMSHGFVGLGLGVSPQLKLDNVAETYYFNPYISRTLWYHLSTFADSPQQDKCLQLAIKACGAAKMENLHQVGAGTGYARSLYGQALRLLNNALRDPKRCKSDEALLAVGLLGYFENLTCTGVSSIDSWKTHTAGSAQLLKIRGPEQFKSAIGQNLFRETRAQVLIHCLWSDLDPPAFLYEYQTALDAVTGGLTNEFAHRADALTTLIYHFCLLRARVRREELGISEALIELTSLQHQYEEWERLTFACPLWTYTAVDVPDSSHVWNGHVHVFNSRNPAMTTWNGWRGMLIMLHRTRRELTHLGVSSLVPYNSSLRATRDAKQQPTDTLTPFYGPHEPQPIARPLRDLTTQICYAIPASLGHAGPAPAAILLTAYGAIWPLFFGAICALDRVAGVEETGYGATIAGRKKIWRILDDHAEGKLTGESEAGAGGDAAEAQARWLLGRLDWIARVAGLKWAEGIVGQIKLDFQERETFRVGAWEVEGESKG